MSVIFHDSSPNSDLFKRPDLLTFLILSTSQIFQLDFSKAFFVLTCTFLFILEVSVLGSG